MATSELSRHINLEPDDMKQLANLCGEFNKNLHLIEQQLGVEINNRGNHFEIIGIPKLVDKACDTLLQLYNETQSGKPLTAKEIQLALKSVDVDYADVDDDTVTKLQEATIHLQHYTVVPRTKNQRHYLKAIHKQDINFGIGPSGTGKTFLAVACAVAALEKEQVSRIVLVRPAVEAGESLGFLPGDLAQKVDPYLRPLYDALYEILGVAKVSKLITDGVIEIAPLAYMRGRTLNDSFIILDEAQNTSKEQMKMFLTRIGFSSKAVITGDITQVDLPKKTLSGLRHAATLLSKIEGIQLTFFTAKDVVRHPLVQSIIEVYEAQEQP